MNNATQTHKQASTITITTADRKRLKALLSNIDRDPPWHLTALRDEIARAKVVEPREIPADVVTMNSTIQVRRGSGDSATFTIVYPEHADIASDCISILSPMGLALIGVRVGDEVEWTTPAGPRRYTIEKLIYQPESARHWDEKAQPPHVRGG